MDRTALSRAINAEDIADAASRVEQTVFVEGSEYSFHHRSGNFVGSQINPLVIVNKDTKKFVPVVTADGGTVTMLSEGVSSITAAGRFVVMSSVNRPVQYTLTDKTLPSAPLHVVWVRGGANSRTFKVFVTIAGVTQTFSYTTLPAYYQGVLDTSDILPYLDPPTNATPNPLYGKLVNDRTNAYNTAVSQHIAAVALDIAPANIALKLANLMIAAGYTDVVADGPYIRIGIIGAVITVDDGGNGDFMRAVSQEITAAELVTPRHYDGKIIKVVPKQANALAFYLKAEATSGVAGEFGEVVWREVSGIDIELTWLFAIGVFISGTFYIAQNPTDLSTLIGQPVPIIEPTSSGDLDSSPIPEFFGRIITYMRMFQDRLMIVAGSTVFLSKSGDYFNFFRKSSLAVSNDDPIEVFAQGTEDDIITAGVQHDRNVILFGQRYQYIVPGRENMTPNNPYVGVQATYEDANLTTPSVAGSLLFFCQRREGRLTLQQMSPGSVADRLDAFDISSQLDGYLTGDPKQIVAMTAPGVVYVRTKDLLNGFYVYSYLDSSDQAERRFDSWSRWVFDESLGTLMGITQDDSGLLAITARTTSAGTELILDRFVRETGPSDYPYLDSQEPAATTKHIGANACVAFDNTSERHLLGTSLALRADIETQFPTELDALRAGTLYDSYVTLTSPYIRDRDDKIILDARLTVSKLTVSLSNAAAAIVSVSGNRGVTWKTSKSWIYRPVGLWVLNTQETAEDAVITAPVMKENIAYRAKISSRSWLPLTISVVEWAGQAFTSRR
jgi:hypothetical protein